MSDNNPFDDLISQLLPDELEPQPSAEGKLAGERSSLLSGALQALAGQGSGTLSEAVSGFLNGEGTLMDATRSALSSGSGAATQVAKFLTDTLGVSPELARAIAPVVIRLFPAVVKEVPKKPRRKAAAKKTTDSQRKSAKSTAKKKPAAAKRPASSSKKAAASSKKKPAAKKKPASSSSKPRRKSTRSETIDRPGEPAE